MIKLAAPLIEQDDLDAVRDVLSSGMLVQGAHAARFEAALAEYVGVSHAIVVSSGTAALHLALLSVGVRPGDCVAVPAFSWPATANVVALSGARPVFVDIDPVTFNMDPSDLAKVMAENRVRAVLPVHAFGGMAPMAELLEVAAGVPVIEDAACALGAGVADRAAGSWGVAACFSFHPRKLITTGEGGAVVTDDEEVARAVRSLRNHGLSSTAQVPDFVRPGFNLRLTDFQAALGCTQLAKLDRILAGRRIQADLYGELLHGTNLQPPGRLDGSQHTYQSYVCIADEVFDTERDQVLELLRGSQIEATIGTHHIPLTSWYRQSGGYERGDFPVTDAVFDRAISLPLHHRLTPEEQEKVVRCLVASLTKVIDRSEST